MACSKMKRKYELLKIQSSRCPLFKELRITQIGHPLVPQRHKKILQVKTVSISLHIPGFVHLVSLMSFGFIRDSIITSLSSRSVLSNKASFMQFGGHLVGQISPQSQVCNSVQFWKWSSFWVQMSLTLFESFIDWKYTTNIIKWP